MFSSQKKEELVAIFDVGSGSVGGALVRMLPKTKPEIIFTARSPIIFKETFNFDSFLLGMTKALTETAQTLESARLGAPAKVFCFLASPWQASQTRIIKTSRSIPFVVTKKMVAELVEKEINIFGAAEASYKTLGEGSELLESEIMQIKLNGYTTAEPFGKSAKDLEIALFVSISPQRILDSLKFNIHKFFNREVKLHSFPFSAFTLTRDLYPKARNFLFIDMAGELTDLALAKDDILEESISFPHGKNSFIREISKGRNSTISESSALLDLFLSRRAEPKLAYEISLILERPKQDWLKALEHSLHEISGSRPLPHEVFITADSDIVSWLKAIIKGEELHQYTGTQSKFNVTILESKVFQPFCKIDSRAEFDPFLMLEAIFIHRI